MTDNNASKCQQCSNYSASGNLCANISSDDLNKLGSTSRSATLKRGDIIDSKIIKHGRSFR
jgi:hypothetical protein